MSCPLLGRRGLTWTRSAESLRLVLVAEPARRERAHRVERGQGLRPPRREAELVPRADPERRHGREASRVHRAVPRREILHPQLGPREGRQRLDQPRHRSRMQSVAVLHLDEELRRRPVHRRGRRLSVNRLARELPSLRLQRRARGLRHLLERGTEPDLHRRGHRPLDERRVADEHASGAVRRHEVAGQPGREHGAAEIDQDQHPLRRPHLLDRALHRQRVGAERVAGGVQPTGGTQRDLGSPDPSNQLHHAARQRVAVGDHHETDHGPAPRVRAAASSRSAAEVAPGSWCPALRSPR